MSFCESLNLQCTPPVHARVSVPRRLTLPHIYVYHVFLLCLSFTSGSTSCEIGIGLSNGGSSRENATIETADCRDTTVLPAVTFNGCHVSRFCRAMLVKSSADTRAEVYVQPSRTPFRLTVLSYLYLRSQHQRHACAGSAHARPT